eukprot:scaffold623113_cov46-Prasinocladus_malaysianus.AAC.1
MYVQCPATPASSEASGWPACPPRQTRRPGPPSSCTPSCATARSQPPSHPNPVKRRARWPPSAKAAMRREDRLQSRWYRWGLTPP